MPETGKHLCWRRYLLDRVKPGPGTHSSGHVLDIRHPSRLMRGLNVAVRTSASPGHPVQITWRTRVKRCAYVASQVDQHHSLHPLVAMHTMRDHSVPPRHSEQPRGSSQVLQQPGAHHPHQPCCTVARIATYASYDKHFQTRKVYPQVEKCRCGKRIDSFRTECLTGTWAAVFGMS